DVSFLKQLKELVLEYIKENRLILVCGGGYTCRFYQDAAKKLSNKSSVKSLRPSDEDLDWIGIMATRLNAELIRVLFKDVAHETVIYNPEEKINTKKHLIIGAGYKPGWSTDYDTVLLAKQFSADLIINTSNIDYVYDKDPNKFKDAKKIEVLSWQEYKQLIGGKFVPGMHAPFDPVASKIAQKEGMEVVICNGNDLINLRNILVGKTFKGTVIK
ncbi:MAG: UMP kinase, partial [Candidatus Woesearchaeota archaeon]